MAAMPAPVLLDEIRRQKAEQRGTEEALMELDAHTLEALALVAFCKPLVSRLVMATQHIGPTANQTATALDAALTRYERRHTDRGGNAA